MAEKQNKKHTVRGGSGKETRDKKNPRIPSQKTITDCHGFMQEQQFLGEGEGWIG